MRACSTQFYILEHYLRLKTDTPENWLSSLQFLTRSPRLSMEVDLSVDPQYFSGRLSFLETGSVNVFGFFLSSASTIFGANAGTNAIIMPLQGTVEFEVRGQHFVSAPGAPFILEAGAEFFARLSPKVHLFIAQPDQLASKDVNRYPENGDPELATLLESYLVETPFFRDHQHAVERTISFGRALNRYIAGDKEVARARKPVVLVGEERRLCRAFELINDYLKTGVDLEKIAMDSGMSLRNFYYLLKKFTGMTPYSYCQSRRLVKARESLVCRHHEDPVIANHAHKWGFNHAGRFSSYYYKHFGEYPSETLDGIEVLKERADKVWSVDAGSPERVKYWYTSSGTADDLPEELRQPS